MGERQDTELIVAEPQGALFRQPSIEMPAAQTAWGAGAIFAGSGAEAAALLICGVLLVGIALAQVAFRPALRSLAARGSTAVAVRAHLLFSWSFGATIGAIGWFGALSGSAPVQMLAAFLVLSATALMGRNGGPRHMATVQIALAILPSAAAWALLAQPVTLVMAALSLLYLALLARLVHRFDTLAKDASNLGEINRMLAERLDQKRIVLEDQDTQLRSQTVLFDAALSHMAQGLVMFDRDFRVLVANRRYAELYGLDADVVRPGATLRELSLAAYEAGGGEATAGSFEAFYKLRLDQARLSSVPQKFVGSMADGRKMQINTRPLQGGGFVVTSEDVTEQLRAVDRIAHLAGHDPLTDLVNRSQLPQRLGDALIEAGTKKGGQVVVFCLDLDGFKAVNDTLGHPSGDMLLKAVAGRLRNLVRAGDTVARLGGDEFVCVLTGLKTRKRIVQCAERIVAALGAPFDLDGRQVKVGASLGIAVAPADGAIAETLLRNADIALYRAKSEGKGTYVFFGPDMERVMRERHQLEADLREGVGRGEFELHYQPLVEMETREVLGFEALMRWRHPTRGLVMPADFIPAAEDTGMIVPLGAWALRTACRDAMSWPANIKIAVNVSPRQFHGDGLLNTVVLALAESSLEPSRLELEITEAVLLRESEETLATLHKLRALGVRIVMDDFGTGYSSLNYLRAFPFDKIKIDGCFVNECETRGENRAIIQAVTDLANGLGITTTVEGVETEDQMRAVMSRGCTEAQGYLFGHALPLAELGGLFWIEADKAAA